MAMHRSTKVFIFLLVIVAAITGYNYFARPFAGLSRNQEQPSEETLAPGNEQAEFTPEVVFEKLSEREKVLQMIAAPVVLGGDSALAGVAQPATSSAATGSAVQPMVSTPTSTVPAATGSAEAWVERNNPGFITFFGEKISRSEAEKTIDRYKSLARLWEQPLVSAIAVDHEGGTVQRLSGAGFTLLPSWQELCALDVTERDGFLKLSSEELSSIEVDFVFAPVLDVADFNPALRNRICSGDHETVLERATSFALAFRDREVTPVFKHFPGIGATTRDLHFGFDRVTVDPLDSRLFRVLLETFPDAAVMVSHVGVENQYPNVPCSLSKPCIDELYTVFPDVMVFPDALNMTAAAYTTDGTRKDLKQVAAEAVLAGNTVLVFGTELDGDDLEDITAELVAQYQSDPAVRQAVDASVKKIIAYKFQHGLTAQPAQ
jgi:beta-N-acetylhexosaminidase